KRMIDELGPHRRARLLGDDQRSSTASSRRLLCPVAAEVAPEIGQWLAFLAACHDPLLADREAQVWLEALAVWRAATESLDADGLPVSVDLASPRARVSPARGQSGLARAAAGWSLVTA